MKVVSRYLSREIALGVLFVLAGFLSLFAFFDLVKELDDLGKGVYRIQHALAFVALSLPSRIYELMPVSALIGTVYALARFAALSEFTAMRAAGMGRVSALQSILLTGLLLALFTALMGEVVSPPTERLAQRLRTGALGTAGSGQFRSGTWIKDTQRDASGQPVSLRFVNIETLNPDASLENVRIFDFSPDLELRSVLQAERAQYDGVSRWKLSGTEETRFESGRTADALPTLTAQVVRQDSRDWLSDLDPDILRVSMVDPARMSLTALVHYTRHLRENKQSPGRFELALWKKVIYPFAVLIMMMLALPFAYLQVRAGSIGYKVFAGIMLGVVFHFMNGLFSNLGMLNTWPAWLTVSIPSLIALTVALLLLARVGSMR
jgi:lipopolysaccharide export system permease protein